jgi:hypothetical protein
MAGKISFPHGNDWGVIGPEGDHDLPVDSILGHRFHLVDGEVITAMTASPTRSAS